ncbi:prolyl oligopeptidase family serine peptidase [Streptomyces sp. P9-2B-2]|uniref:S9 family peptidase n=1 Tax=Streptomyces sp. P9-2B-2 TaxID=3057114 RepID=UPI0025B58332|nr:prolyl oligopeptidase family serine peptidase [Streptomyces sp. P9-2B-2]WJY37081.1 prolyl oligopeptidase family serine peptidase [Streptomyces sp. P9-2B-2]
MYPTRLDTHAYRTAEQLLRHNRGKLVHGGKIRPRWIDGGARFWYTVDSGEGRRFILVDPAKGTRVLAFDHERLAAALAAASGQEVDPAMLPFAAFEPTADGMAFHAFGERWTCALGDYTCARTESLPTRNVLEVVAPDGRHAVFRDGYDIRARSLADSKAWPLTDDGTHDRDYGANPDYFMYSTLLPKIGIPHLPPAVVWSPDSTRVLTHRSDQRGVRRTHLVQALPPDDGAPQLLTQRFAFPGDERLPLAEFVVLDIAAQKAVPALAEPVAMPMMSPITRQWAWWAKDSSAVYYLSSTRDTKVLSLQRLDPDSGEVRTVFSELGTTRVEPAQFFAQAPMVEVLSAGEEVLWYSQRDGWGHLYLYGAQDGELRAQVTSGPWAVRQILHVDEERRVVYFLASGLVEADPYRRTVCRVGLDGSGFAKVTHDDLDHVVTVPPDLAYFIDSASTNATEPVITVRGWDGRVLVELERADISGLLATGWSAPERFRVTAADGETDIYGMLYRPHGFDPAKRYPVLDHPYCFPNASRVSPSFDPGFYGYDAEVLAALGFVVIAVDGRGSPGRSKAFHDASYGRIADAVGLADHVAALRELGRTRPWMDLDRIGAFGTSAGGFATVRAMLDFPDVFKAGVAEGGMHDIRYAELGMAEAYNGPWDSAAYAAASNVDIAGRLTGKLLLVHGGLDDSVSPDQTLRLAERLIAADKDFELLVLPGADHVYVGYDHYVNRRRWDFLVRHLMGVEPPADYRLAPVPLDMDAVDEIFG